MIVIDDINELAKRNASSGSGIEMHQQNSVYDQQACIAAHQRLGDMVS